MKRLLADMSRTVMVSLGVIAVALIIFATAIPMLTGALDDASVLGSRLRGDAQLAARNAAQAKADQQYVREHQQEFEALIGSDRLVPHTRRAALVELQKAARIRGLTGLDYSFNAATANSLKAVESQPQSGAYTVSVENIELKVEAPLDGPIYNYISDINESFPGAVVLEELELKRLPEVTPLALELVSRGEHSQLVTGSLKLSWRTAQAQDKKVAEPGK